MKLRWIITKSIHSEFIFPFLLSFPCPFSSLSLSSTPPLYRYVRLAEAVVVIVVNVGGMMHAKNLMTAWTSLVPRLCLDNQDSLESLQILLYLCYDFIFVPLIIICIMLPNLPMIN